MPKKLIWLLIFFGSLKILIHFLANANYGLHADELYYIALSKNLHWGYLDNSPFVAFITRLSNIIFGESTFSYRIFPTLFSAATVCLTGFITFRLGGKYTAISIACLAIVVSPAYLATSYLLQPVVFEQFFWTLAAALLLVFVQSSKNKYLYAFAAVSAIGFLNKYTILLFLLTLFIGLVVTRGLTIFKWKPAALCIAIFIIIVLPNFLWQMYYGFPIFNYLRVVKENTHFLGVGAYLFQITFFHATGVAVWLAGFLFLLFSKRHKRYMFFSIAFVVFIVALLLMKSKIYYGLGAFPVLFAAGGVCWEMMFKRVAIFYKTTFYALLIVPSLVALPIVVPLLPFKLTIAYLKLMTTYTNIYQPLIWEDGKVHATPQIYADMLGWKDIATKVEKIYEGLSPIDQKNIVIFSDNYFIVGALSHYLNNGTDKIVSPNSSFALWSPKKLTAEKVIYVKLHPDKNISKNAVEFILADSVNYPYSRIDGTHIYLLDKPSNLFKKKYVDERNHFYKRLN